MKIKRYLPRLERMVADDLGALEKKTIFVDNGVYHVFGCYQIQSRDNLFPVTRRGQPIEEFRSLRDAMAWCSADRLGKHQLSMSILALEQQRQITGADLAARTHLAKKIRDPDRRESVMIKLEHRKAQLREIENQLDKCVNLAKYWQIQGFNNETPRTGRTASHRTSI